MTFNDLTEEEQGGIIHHALESANKEQAKIMKYNVSEWAKIGKERGYCDYFKDLIIIENNEKIKNDLLQIADNGEFEDMRREVNNYFK